MGRRLVLYDDTCGLARGLPLTWSWRVGSALYAGLGRVDGAHGCTSWEHGLAWLGSSEGPIDELQFWGHGRWGELLVDGDPFASTDLLRGAERAPAIDRLAARLRPASLVWLRTCETFGADRGQAFAAALADRLGCRVAGFTYVIGVFQSGLHSLEPGATPQWSNEEGLAAGDARAPKRALGSSPGQPHTISCLSGAVPAGW